MVATVGLQRRLVTLACLVALAGCGSDDPVSVENTGPAPYPDATRPDVLVENLVRSYEELRVDEYDRLVSEDMVFYFAPEDVDELGQGPTWDRDRDMLSALAMMRGWAGTNPDGTTLVSIENIEMRLTEDAPGAPWTSQVPEEFAGTLMKRYRVEMDVTLSDRFLEEITGLHEFYVERDVQGPAGMGKADGAYRLRYWRDLGVPTSNGARAPETSTWGRLKAAYRFDPPAGALVTRDGVIDALASSYRFLSEVNLDTVLDPYFLFFSPPEVDVGFTPWSRQDEVAAASNMFGGRTGVLPDGWDQPPVESIQIQLAPEGEGWTEAILEEFAGTWLRRFDVQMRVDFEDGSAAEVTGPQEFYLASGPSVEIEGISFDAWTLRFWRDLGEATRQAPAVEGLSWSELKARFREEWTGPPAYPPARTPDELVANLERAYDERNYPEYEKLLHDGFVFYFPPDEIDLIGQGASWERARDLASAASMCAGQPGQRPDGSPQAPIMRVDLLLSEDAPGVPWTDQVAEAFAGTVMKRFRVDMDVFFTEGNPVRVLGLQEFYAVPVDGDPKAGSTVNQYQLRYWRDLGKDIIEALAASEAVSWGMLKAAY